MNYRIYLLKKQMTIGFLQWQRILSLRGKIKENGKPVIIVSKDALVRVKADAIGLTAEDFLSDRVVEVDHIYTGFLEVYLPVDLLGRFYEKGELLLSEIANHTILPESVSGYERCTWEVRPQH